MSSSPQIPQPPQPEAGLYAWHSLQRALAHERNELREIRTRYGLMFARAEQVFRTMDIGDEDLMEQLFLTGCFSHPQSIGLIEQTRTTYYHLLELLPPEEEEWLEELGQLRETLSTALNELQRRIQESFTNHFPLTVKIDFGSTREVLKGYQEFPDAPPAVRDLVAEIEVILSDLDRIAKQFPG